MYKHLKIGIFSASLIIFSCKKNYNYIETSFSKPNNFSSTIEIKDYVNKQLQTYAIVFAELAKDQEIRYLVHQNVAKQFDGDDNVLIKDLIISAEKKGINLKEKFDYILKKANQNISSEQLLASLNDINKQNVYPHIYIPNFEKFNLLNNDKSDKSKSTDAFQDYIDKYPYPVMVAYDGDESVTLDYYTGYTYATDETFIDDIHVNEEFTNENEVWVITPNENVNNDGVMVAPPTFTNNTLNSNVTERPDLYFPNMTVKEHKESWIKGASEVCIYVGVSWDNGIDPSNGKYSTTFWTNPGMISLADRNSDVNNIEIRKFSRKEVSKKKNIDINFTYFPLSSEIYYIEDPCLSIRLRSNQTPQQNVIDYNACKMQNQNITHYFYPERGDYLYYCIYEYDTGLFNSNGTSSTEIQGTNYIQKIYYRSNESPYFSGRLKIVPRNQATQSYENTSWANINDEAISFTSRHR